MTAPRIHPLAVALLLLAGALAPPARSVAAPVGTAFTYQGRLEKGAVPYTGLADLTFRLHDDLGAGTQVGADVGIAGVAVQQGYFTVELDFGPVFDGTALFLEIEVQTPGDAGYTLLTPRVPMHAVPYAVRALEGPSGGGSSQWTDTAYGIEYSAGNVGLGAAARVDRKLWIDTGTLDGNPLWVRNQNASYAALAVQNDAPDGFGLYDGWSDRHYFAGRLGVGTLNPSFPVDVNAPNEPAARFVSKGSTLTSGTHAALYVSGLTGTGLFGTASDGIFSTSTDGRGISGWSTNHWGVSGDCTSAGTYGVLGTPQEGVLGSSPSVTKPAGRFNAPVGGIAIEANGLVKVKTLQILGGADLAERFEVEGDPAPGTVLVLDPSAPGRLRAATESYSPHVAGVVSGANALDAGIILSRDEHTAGTAAVALTGRVWVQCDATEVPIRIGDLLTTSANPGHAMKASDRDRAFGSVLGKAMSALERGTGMVLVLVSLQ
jgi:hypothetical protein